MRPNPPGTTAFAQIRRDAAAQNAVRKPTIPSFLPQVAEKRTPVAHSSLPIKQIVLIAAAGKGEAAVIPGPAEILVPPPSQGIHASGTPVRAHHHPSGMWKAVGYAATASTVESTETSAYIFCCCPVRDA